MLKVLKLGSSGQLVVQWQEFLRGQGYPTATTGLFDASTESATKAFQRKHKLADDGKVGNQTLGKAASLGFELVDFTDVDPDFPSKPDFSPILDTAKRQSLFGPLEFTAAPSADNPEAIRITNGWESMNLLKVAVPSLSGIKGANSKGEVWFHKKASDQLVNLWRAWTEAGLADQILTFDGAFNARFVRGLAHQQVLSNHAFGTAFDINYAWNKLGTEPAPKGQKGCVYDLVPIAHRFGFYWGGHFTRRDGMHFEVAKIL